MTVQQYLDKKRNMRPDNRKYCYVCDRASSVCLCELIEPFDTNTRFVVLMHPKEARKQRCGTGRLSHLALRNSRLHVGIDFTNDEVVNSLINDKEYTSVLLFPSPQAVNVSKVGYRALLGQQGKLQIFVVDGTWALASKILKMSGNLRKLPAVTFTSRQPSNFKFKKQPQEEFLSTIESIHFLLKLGQEQGIENSECNIKQLPEIFDRLVQIQLEAENSSDERTC